MKSKKRQQRKAQDAPLNNNSHQAHHQANGNEMTRPYMGKQYIYILKDKQFL
jgi:hypothetical protein